MKFEIKEKRTLHSAYICKKTEGIQIELDEENETNASVPHLACTRTDSE